MKWTEIEPKDAVGVICGDPEHGYNGETVEGPINEMDEMCPWPWDPQQLKGAPLGMYHCGYCGSMVVAGIPHGDYSESNG